MTDPHTQNYADRIAESAAADGWPWRLTAGEAAALAGRYGAAFAATDAGPHPLRQVATAIAADVLQRAAIIAR